MRSSVLAVCAAAACLAAACLTATAASAKIVTVTLTGDSENINDVTGVFGAPGSRITDESFVEVFTINTDGGNVLDSPTGVSFNNIFGTTGPYAVGASLTVGGHTPAFVTQGSTYSSVYTGSDYQILSNDQDAPSGEEKNANFYLDLSGSPMLPSTVTQPLSLNLAGLYVSDGFIDGLTDHFGNPIVSATGSLNPTSITISATPEPATWVLMFAGVGLAGAALRRDRRRAAPMVASAN